MERRREIKTRSLALVTQVEPSRGDYRKINPKKVRRLESRSFSGRPHEETGVCFARTASRMPGKHTLRESQRQLLPRRTAFSADSWVQSY